MNINEITIKKVRNNRIYENYELITMDNTLYINILMIIMLS